MKRIILSICAIIFMLQFAAAQELPNYSKVRPPLLMPQNAENLSRPGLVKTVEIRNQNCDTLTYFYYEGLKWPYYTVYFTLTNTTSAPYEQYFFNTSFSSSGLLGIVRSGGSYYMDISSTSPYGAFTTYEVDGYFAIPTFIPDFPLDQPSHTLIITEP